MSTPLPRKLGIEPRHRLLLMGAPEGLDLGPLAGVDVSRRVRRAPYDVILAFAADLSALHRCFRPLRKSMAADGALWVAWPKRASGVRTDLNENVVRVVGLGAGLVDTKVAAIDATWSGLRFVVRLRDRPR